MNRLGLVLVSLLSLVGVGCAGQDDAGDNTDQVPSDAQNAVVQGRTHLVLLSGQSNMSRMVWADELAHTGYLLDKVLKPTLQTAFPKDEFILVPVAEGGRPISAWVPNGPLYRELIADTNKAKAGKNISTITFIWRQGEADHQVDALTKAYEGNLRTLYNQLKADLNTPKINWVIGRLNDAAQKMDPTYEQHDNWMLIRQVEEKVANSIDRARMVNCDRFNDHNNEDVHGAPEDYLNQQKAFADSTIELIKAFP